MPSSARTGTSGDTKQGPVHSMDEIAKLLGLGGEDFDSFGKNKSKFTMGAIERLLRLPRRGKVILVTAITPTKAGEGKTTIAIGLADGLSRLGKPAIAALRQPSLGPVFGQKGGATGGGRVQLFPAAEINLHFTGDFHAIAAANNLLAAMTDNHLFHGNQLSIDSSSITLHRALDMNDRALREVEIEVGKGASKRKRKAGFDITAASEVMAVLCLAESHADLRQRLSRIVVAKTENGKPVTAHDLGAVGAMEALLVDALRPNIVQTAEGTPAIIHGGPFANIAHGCSSLLGTKLALRLADYVVTEAGFGADLGFEKYCDFLSATRAEEVAPSAVVIVVTLKALKLHGGAAATDLHEPNADAVKRGLCNLQRHTEIVSASRLPLVVAINKHTEDTDDELKIVGEFCVNNKYPVAVANVWTEGGAGATQVSELVCQAASAKSKFQPFYEQAQPITEKLQNLAEKVYRAKDIVLSAEAKQSLDWLDQQGFGNLPVCVAKTQYSLSDDAHKLGAPEDFTMTVNDLHLSAGAGFVVARMGEISTMPGLPAHPNAENVSVDEHGRIIHLT